MVDVGKLKDLELKLKSHDLSIDSILQRLQTAADDKMLEQNEKLLQQIEETGNKILKRIEKEAKERKKWEEVIRKHGIGAVSQAASSSDVQPWLLIKKDLMNQGLSEEDADKILDPVRSELCNIQVPQTENESPNPIVIPLRPTTPDKSKNQNLKPFPAPRRSPSPKPNSPSGRPRNTVTIRATAKTKEQNIEYNRSRVLFVDDSNARKYSRRTHFFSALYRITCWSCIQTRDKLGIEGAQSCPQTSPYTRLFSQSMRLLCSAYHMSVYSFSRYCDLLVISR